MEQGLPLGLRIAIIDRAIKRKMDRHTEEMGLTAVQLRVLGEISRLEDAGAGEINQRDLERREQVTHPTMTGIIQRLEAKGFVKCVPSPKDRRYKKIACTEKARHIHAEIAAKDRCVMEEICKGLTREEIGELIRLTDRILDNIPKEH